MAGAISVEELQILITANYGDAIKKFTEVADEMARVAAQKLEPVKKMMDKAVTPTASNNNTAFQQVEKTAQAVKRAADTSKMSLDELRAKHQQLENDLWQQTKQLATQQQYLKSMKASWGNIDGVVNYENKVRAAREELQRGVQESKRLADAIRQAEGNADRMEDELGQSDKEVKKTANSTAKARKEMDKTSKSAGDIGKRLSSSAKTLSKFGASIRKSITKPFETAGKKIGGLLKGIGSSVLYSTIFRAITLINEAIAGGINNLYQYSKALNGTFAGSMDRLSTSALYIKNTFAAMVEPLINAVAPALDMIADRAVEVLNVVNQTVARLTGASSWTKAVKVQKEYAEATEDTAKAAEKVKRAVAGFDEVNILSFNKDEKKDGTSATEPSPTTMFEEVKLDVNYTNPILDMISDIRQAIDSGDWAGLGQSLADKVNGLISGVDFSGLGQKAGTALQSFNETVHGFLSNMDFQGVGSGFAESLNGIMDTVDFTLAGETLANGLNAVIDTAYGFVQEFDWDKFGTSVGDYLNGALLNIKWDTAVKTLNDGVIGLMNSLQAALQRTRWNEIGNTIGASLNQIQWSEIVYELMQSISDVIVSAVDFLSGFIEGIDWYDLGQEIVKSLDNLIRGIKWGDIIASAFELLGAALGGATQLINGLLKASIDRFAEGWISLKEYFKKYTDEAGGNIILGIFNGILDALKNVGQWIVDNIFTPFIDGFKKAFGIHSPSTVMAEQGEFLIEGLFGGIKDTWTKVKNFFTTSLDNIKTTFSNALNKIKTTGKNIFNSMLGGIEKMVNGVIRGINTMVNALNKISFDIPDWVPALGGKTFGFNLKEVATVSIPRLENGAVLRAPTLNIAGEYAGARTNPEIVAPQNVIYDTVVEANAPLVSALYDMFREVIAAIDNKDSNLYLDGEVVGSTSVRYINTQKRITGVSPV